MVLAQSRIFSQIAPKICAVFWRNLGFCPNSFFHPSRNKLYFCRLLIPYKIAKCQKHKIKCARN